MADEQRRRLHEIVDRLPPHELTLARQLLELLATGHVSPRSPGADGQAEMVDLRSELAADVQVPDAPALSPEVAARLAELSDDELLRLDELLERDLGAARLFWRERFGEELPDAGLVGDGLEADGDGDDENPGERFG